MSESFNVMPGILVLCVCVCAAPLSVTADAAERVRGPRRVINLASGFWAGEWSSVPADSSESYSVCERHIREGDINPALCMPCHAE